MALPCPTRASQQLCGLQPHVERHEGPLRPEWIWTCGSGRVWTSPSSSRCSAWLWHSGLRIIHIGYCGVYPSEVSLSSDREWILMRALYYGEAVAWHHDMVAAPDRVHLTADLHLIKTKRQQLYFKADTRRCCLGKLMTATIACQIGMGTCDTVELRRRCRPPICRSG